jgi:hypothetical protein
VNTRAAFHEVALNFYAFDLHQKSSAGLVILQALLTTPDEVLE